MKFQEKKDVIHETDCLLPINNIDKIMKNGVPQNAKVSKAAKETMQACTSEFISFVTSEASDRCVYEKRRTITGEDIINSLELLGFENHAYFIRSYYSKLRDIGKQ
ncbi:MAG: CCAAT binding transcription factor subunit A [Amphiamblys sp. WSBS2006]|nr:MAG: CCAAT binding transcription factor subunit A [Amphiamblys sp. WSBS2006]